jgi:hypothetical protein
MQEIIKEEKIEPKSILVFGPLAAKVEQYFHQSISEVYKKSNANGIIWVCMQNSGKRTKEKIPFKIETLWFVDTVSKVCGLERDERDTIYCDPPSNYISLSEAVDNLVDKNGRSIVVYDNLNAALSYLSPDVLVKLLRNRNTKLAGEGNTIIYLLIQGTCDSKIENAIQAMMDTIFKIGDSIEIISGANIYKFPRLEEVKSTTWREVLSLEKPLLYSLLLALVLVNVCLTILTVRLALGG